MLKKTIKLKRNDIKFQLSSNGTIVKVVNKGAVLAEITLCSDGFLITQTRADFIKFAGKEKDITN